MDWGSTLNRKEKESPAEAFFALSLPDYGCYVASHLLLQSPCFLSHDGVYPLVFSVKIIPFTYIDFVGYFVTAKRQVTKETDVLVSSSC